MKKRSFNYLVWAMALTGTVLGGSYAFANRTAARIREDVARYRAEHPLKQAAAKAPQARVEAASKDLFGFHSFSYDGDLLDWSGIAKVIPGATAPEPILDLEPNIFQAVNMNGKLFTVHFDSFQEWYDENTLVTWMITDQQTGEAEMRVNYTINSEYVLPYGMAYDHTTGKVYGSFYKEPAKFTVTDDAVFGEVNFSNAFEPVTVIGEFPERMRALTFDAAGDLFALTYGGDLYKVNKFNGEVTATGVHVDLPTQDEGDPTDSFYSYGRDAMCCDWETGMFYVSYSDDIWNSYIACFDPNTGEVEMFADYSYSDFGSWDCNVFTGLYFEQKADAPDVATPAAVTDLKVTAVGIELKADVTFTMPAADVQGNALDADLTWTVSDGNATLGTGTAHSGETVTTEVATNAGGRVNFVVTATLGDAVSAPVTAQTFIGCDTPEVWGTPTARVAGNKVTVRWEEAYAINNGNMAPVTYRVTRMPDEVVVAEDCTTNEFVDEIASDYKTVYTYVIVPKAGEVEGEAVTSRAAIVGKYLRLPLDEQFDNEQMFLQYPVIDANGDDNVWEYSTKYDGVAVYPANGNDANDYLLIGPFKMSKGSAYSFHMVADGHNFNETIAVYVGTDEDNVRSFNYELLAPTVLDPMKGQKSFNLSFEPENTGDYYFGIKACSEGASQYIYVYEVVVKEVGGEAPAAPESLVIEPGENTAVIKATMPDITISGEILETLTGANIYRDNELIATITENVTPGSEIEYEDTDAVSRGNHNYAVAAVNAQGEGKTVAAQVYRGLDFPGRPSNVRFWEDLETPGKIHVTFDAPAAGYYGGWYDPENTVYTVDYLVMGAQSGQIVLGKGTEHTFDLPFAVTAQDLFAGSIFGRNSAGAVAQSGNWATAVCYFGPALELPIRESWPNQTSRSGIWGGQSIDDEAGISSGFWDISSGSDLVPPQDNDGGMQSLSTSEDGMGKRLLSPRVTLAGAENPTFTFYYRYTKDAQEFNLEVLVEDQPIRVLMPLDLAAENAGEWIRMEVSLNDFKAAKYIQLAFSGRGLTSYDFASVDNVAIADLKQYDLTVTSFNAPARADVNTEVTLTLGVRNNGAKKLAAADYRVVFYKNGAVLEEYEGMPLNADAVAEFTATDIPMVVDPAENVYYAVVYNNQDANPDDNTSAEARMRVIIPEYPTVTGLTGQPGNGVTLNWEKPDMSKIPGQSTTETFDSYQPFIINNIGQWGVYDGDGFNTVILSTALGVLDYPYIGTPIAWQVIDPAAAGIISGAWYARSGSNLLASFQASAAGSRDLTCNDWLISPELNGEEQVVSFYSRAGHAGYAPELFDFMISDKTAAVEDFKALASDVEVPYASDWVEYTFRVPAGTKHFAIVHKSFGKVAMLVDDITYIPAGAVDMPLVLEGYNVYRYGSLINETPVTATSYIDSNVEEGVDYEYCVSAVYNMGETNVSQTITVKATHGVSDAEEYQLTISGRQGFIRIEGGIGETAYIYTTSGVCVAAVKAEGVVDVPVAADVYVVRAGDAAVKVAVR